MKRVYTLQLIVEAPTTTGESEVENALNAALDEPPCDWGNWTVGAARIIAVDVEGMS
jgi:hypothetical protein